MVGLTPDRKGPDLIQRRPPTRPAIYWDAIKASLAQAAEANLALISAGVAFFAMLSLFPALAALIALLGLISDPVVVVAQLEDVRGLLPDDVYDIINTQVTGLVTARADTLGWAGVLSLFVALWSARAGVGAMVIGLNTVYGERNRKAARHYLHALLLTISLVAVGIVALLTVVVAPIFLAFIPLGPFGNAVADLLRWTVAVVVLFAGVGVLYRFGPNRRAPRMAWLSSGAILAVMSWAAVSVGFSYYVANFGNYNQVYGSIGAVIAMLIWLWISSFLILFGAALNAQIERRTRPDSTIGKPKPRGQRGATAADTWIKVDSD
ncbi:membrane protein [Sulfitobacter delicatus]|jgi:membrane protein|uniref:Membrane protein n=1 Tax=Sulfitobacter delicatus TaxID=218672 RepID=A0A1G7J7T6_9RHOB|nr:membrane protein [Sulfitobacter delicatus]